MAYEKKKCWSILLRLYHWAFALSIVTLCITGFYINSPWTNSMQEGSASWPMAYARLHPFCRRLCLYRRGADQDLFVSVR